MSSAQAAGQSPPTPAGPLTDERLLCAGQSYIERLGIVYMDQIRLTIVTELYSREMGMHQFFETIGGSSYHSIRRHFIKLVEFGWIRKVRTVINGKGRPEALYRAAELPVIDTEAWRLLPFSIRDAFTVQLLEEMGKRLGEALAHGTADARGGRVATFKAVDGLDEQDWCKAYDAVERCFHKLLHEQDDAKIRLKNSGEQPLQMVVNLAAFEAPSARGKSADIPLPLPKADETSSPPPWPQPVGKVFTDRLDFAIVEELNQATMTPQELEATLGGMSRRGFLSRCRRLAELGLAVEIETTTGGPPHGTNGRHFRAAAPNVSESDIFEGIPAADRHGVCWQTLQRFIATSIAAVDAGTFNSRFDRHLTMSLLTVDEIGRTEINRALRVFEKTVLQLEATAAKRRQGKKKKGKGFRAAFLVSNFETPIRELRH